MRARRQLVIGQALVDHAVALLERNEIVVRKRLGGVLDAFVALVPAGEIAVLERICLAERVARGAEGEKDAEAGDQGTGHAQISRVNHPRAKSESCSTSV